MSKDSLPLPTKFQSEHDIIKNYLENFDSLSKQERIESIKNLFKEICKMDKFISIYPSFRYAIIKKIKEFHDLIELDEAIYDLKLFLERIKYRKDYILDEKNGEKPPEKIMIEI